MILRILLYPFSVVYDVITRIRNHFYDSGLFRSFSFHVPVIGVGNLSVGGTGKTPMVEYLIRLLRNEHKIVSISRGFGRNTRGMRLADAADDAGTIGDESFQVFKKYHREIKVVVSEDRASAISTMMKQFPETQVVLLDDAFQHRSVKPKLNILLTPYAKPFYSDFILPSGRLRETRTCAARADIVVVTKCEASPPEEEIREITNHIQHYAGPRPVFFSSIRYADPVPFNGNIQPFRKVVLLVSGIAQADQFEKYAAGKFQVLKHFQFPDHHAFQVPEIESVVTFAKQHASPPSILTTEKDWARLIDSRFSNMINETSWFYLPIETIFIKNGAEFDRLVLECCQKK